MTPFRREADTWDGATTRELAARPAPDRTVRIGGVPHAAGTVRETIHALVAALQHFAGDGADASCCDTELLACGFTADEIARLVPTASGLWMAELLEPRAAAPAADLATACDVATGTAPAGAHASGPTPAEIESARQDVVDHLERLLGEARRGAIELIMTVAMSSAGEMAAGRAFMVGIHGGATPDETAALFAALEPARRQLAPPPPARGERRGRLQ